MLFCSFIDWHGGQRMIKQNRNWLTTRMKKFICHSLKKEKNLKLCRYRRMVKQLRMMKVSFVCYVLMVTRFWMRWCWLFSLNFLCIMVLIYKTLYDPLLLCNDTVVATFVWIFEGSWKELCSLFKKNILKFSWYICISVNRCS